jgi:hypothetical protein
VLNCEERNSDKNTQSCSIKRNFNWTVQLYSWPDSHSNVTLLSTEACPEPVLAGVLRVRACVPVGGQFLRAAVACKLFKNVLSEGRIGDLREIS